jgi:D-sedoheptulose 7-phosphate isomerase
LKQSTMNILEDTPSNVHHDLVYAFIALQRCFSNGGKLLACGNGGSASDAQHIVAELMKSFTIKRKNQKIQWYDSVAAYYKFADELFNTLEPGFPAISLSGENALITAIANDNDPELIFAQQVYVLGNSNDVLLAISTSGKSRNIIRACQAAKIKGMHILGLLGRPIYEDADSINYYCDGAMHVNYYDDSDTQSYITQEKHIKIYHRLCQALENEFFGEDE